MKLFKVLGVAAGIMLPFVDSGFASEPAPQPVTLKISHQFPSGNDFRDQLVKKFAEEVTKKTNGALKFDIYPNSSLMKTNAQIGAIRKGALDLSLVPISYEGGSVPEFNIGLMPALVVDYEQGAKWKNEEVGKLLAKIAEEKGIKIIAWIWQAGGVAARSAPLVVPADAKGMKVRGGSREMDMVLKEAGAAVLTLPSNEIYIALQTRALDAAMTSSTSLISFKLEEVTKFLTTGRGKAYWFMLEPLIMSKSIFDKLPRSQQEIIMTVGAEMEKFGMEAAKADDKLLAEVYVKAGAKVFDLTPADIEKWREIARKVAWPDYAKQNENCAKLLELAQKTL